MNDINHSMNDNSSNDSNNTDSEVPSAWDTYYESCYNDNEVECNLLSFIPA